MKLQYIALIIFAAVAWAGCKKEKSSTPTEANTGTMKVHFDYVFGSNREPWQLGKRFVHPKTGDTMTFTTFKFYVSNIKLKKSDNTWWVQPESYFLIDAGEDGKSTMSIADIPAGTYTEMEYTMGVDSASNVSGANTGALSLANAMYWDWYTGYIMLKAEGNSPQSPTGTFAIHPGGFSGEYNVITIKTTDFAGATLTVEKGKTPMVMMVTNPARLWHTVPGLSTKSTIHEPGPEAKQMAKDFYNGISFASIVTE